MRGRPHTAGLAMAAAVVVALTPTPSRADGATAAAKINIAIKSVTLSTTNLTYGACMGGYSSGGLLGFPNGTCTTGKLTITNGTAPSVILVSGSNAVPSDNGTPWAICGGPGSPACDVTATGTDQFAEQDGSLTLGLNGACDPTFATSPCGQARPGQSTSESLKIHGPSSSTDQSASFTTQITWTAT